MFRPCKASIGSRGKAIFTNVPSCESELFVVSGDGSGGTGREAVSERKRKRRPSNYTAI